MLAGGSHQEIPGEVAAEGSRPEQEQEAFGGLDLFEV